MSEAIELADDNQAAQYLKIDPLDENYDDVKPIEIIDQYGTPQQAIRLNSDLVGNILEWLELAVAAYGRGLGRNLSDCAITIGSYGINIIDQVEDGRDRDNYPAYRDEPRFLSTSELCNPYEVGKAQREAREALERRKREEEEERKLRQQEANRVANENIKRQQLERLAKEFGFALTPQSQEE